ncbi:MAG: FAD/NAD(P)-binding protein [Acidimicrobiales bacterium]
MGWDTQETDNMQVGRPRTAIVGGGAAGVLAAIHIARRDPFPREILIFEPAERLGAGAAYSTEDPKHLLNVPARCMSAFESEPDDFTSWIARHCPFTGPEDFAQRRLYRRYLNDCLERSRRSASKGTTIKWVRERVVDIGYSEGGSIRVNVSHGESRTVNDVVLAIGPPPSSALSSFGLKSSRQIVSDPWTPGALSEISPDDEVLVIGTGLTMVDVCLVLGTSPGRRIHAVSRNGWTPAAHEANGFSPWPNVDFDGALTASEVLRRFRAAVSDAESSGGGWRNVVSAARSKIPAVWGELPDAEKQRLLRHVSRRWDVHRHRMCPQVSRSIGSMIAGGRLSVEAGRVVDIVPVVSNRRVRFEAVIMVRGIEKRIEVATVVDCTGPGTTRPSSVIGRMYASGIARPHPTGLGMDVDEDGCIRGADGFSHPGIHTIGWARRGSAFESTAIPELRVQASQLSERIARRETSARSSALALVAS